MLTAERATPRSHDLKERLQLGLVQTLRQRVCRLDTVKTPTCSATRHRIFHFQMSMLHPTIMEYASFHLSAYAAQQMDRRACCHCHFTNYHKHHVPSVIVDRALLTERTARNMPEHHFSKMDWSKQQADVCCCLQKMRNVSRNTTSCAATLLAHHITPLSKKLRSKSFSVSCRSRLRFWQVCTCAHLATFLGCRCTWSRAPRTPSPLSSTCR